MFSVQSNSDTSLERDVNDLCHVMSSSGVWKLCQVYVFAGLTPLQKWLLAVLGFMIFDLSWSQIPDPCFEKSLSRSMRTITHYSPSPTCTWTPTNSKRQDWIAHYWFRGATPEELMEDNPQQFQDKNGGHGVNRAWREDIPNVQQNATVYVIGSDKM